VAVGPDDPGQWQAIVDSGSKPFRPNFVEANDHPPDAAYDRRSHRHPLKL
jgi:hypothetical protein